LTSFDKFSFAFQSNQYTFFLTLQISYHILLSMKTLNLLIFSSIVLSHLHDAYFLKPID